MYASPVPLMVIRADTDALIEVNGSLLGECTKGGYVAMPVSDTGDYYVCATPLSGGRYAVTRKLRFENGSPCDPLVSDVSVCVWPGGVVEFTLQTGNPPPSECEVCETLCQAAFGAYALTLCLSSELQLYAERDAKPFCRYTLGNYESGKFVPYGEWMGLLLYGREQRLLLFDSDMQAALDLRGSAVFLEETPVLIERLPTLLGHEKRTRYVYTDGGFAPQKVELGFLTKKRPLPQDTRSLGIAFFEAVREGFAEEAMSYLTSALRSAFTFSEIAAFLGPFCSVRTPLSNPSGRMIGLAGAPDAQTQTVRLYRLSFEDGRIANISEEE